MNDLLSRIYIELNKQNKNPSDLCKDTGIASSTFFTWKKKDKIPPTESLLKIAKFLNSNLDYLVSGNPHEIYLNSEAEEIALAIVKRPELKVLFSLSKNASKEKIEAINNIIKQMSN